MAGMRRAQKHTLEDKYSAVCGAPEMRGAQGHHAEM